MNFGNDTIQSITLTKSPSVKLPFSRLHPRILCIGTGISYNHPEVQFLFSKKGQVTIPGDTQRKMSINSRLLNEGRSGEKTIQ